ncbi:MAG: SDR family NAD(P)-dependent oxidoreductase, partial [Bacteroidales bacterium]|nr:SDR family NAD(P)-dependent oxidoreductase [Bacteroidales bacterium]
MKYALVTGGSRGIGRSVCLELSRMGYPVIINYVSNENAALEVKSTIEAEGGVASLLRFDVADVEAVDKALLQWQESNPNDYIAVLVNNAGIRDDALMMWMQNSQWDRIIGIHLNGFFYVTRRLL